MVFKLALLFLTEIVNYLLYFLSYYLFFSQKQKLLMSTLNSGYRQPEVATAMLSVLHFRQNFSMLANIV